MNRYEPLIYTPQSQFDAQILPPKSYEEGAGGLENKIFSQSQRRNHPEPAAHKPPYFISCGSDYCNPIYKLPPLVLPPKVLDSPELFDDYMTGLSSNPIAGYAQPHVYWGKMPFRKPDPDEFDSNGYLKQNFGLSDGLAGSTSSIPAGITVVKVPPYVLGENVLGRAFIYQGFIQIREDMHGNDYEEVLLHELLHIFHPEKDEKEIRDMTRTRLPFVSRYN